MTKSLYLFAFVAMTLLAAACTKTANTPPAPVAAFGVPTGNLLAQEAIIFTNTSTGTDVSYQWDFGDGAASSEKSPTHTYIAAGSYTVKLTATNSGGSNSTTKTITVVSATSLYTKVYINKVVILQFPAADTYLRNFDYSVKDYLGNTIGGYPNSPGDPDIYTSNLPLQRVASNTIESTAIAENMTLTFAYYNSLGNLRTKTFTFKPIDYREASVGGYSQIAMNTTDGWGIRIYISWGQ